MNHSRYTAVLAAMLLLASVARISHAADDDGFVGLFNGKDLTGWNNPFDWGKAWVEDGAIHLQADKKFFLVTEKTYGDFTLEAEIMLPEVGPANSGIMFRCHVAKNKVYGYQAECDPKDRAWTGGLYDEGRRGWLHPKAGEEGKVKLVQAPLNQWIKYRIEVAGDHIQIFIDGKRTTDYRDGTDATGHIGIQHHGEKGKTYKFRNIRIKQTGEKRAAADASATPAGEWVTLFDGKSLDGWKQHGGTAKYEVKDGAIVGTSVPKTHNSFMCTNGTYRDFELEFEVKVHPQLNSGVQVRSAVKGDKNREIVAGPQIEIEASPGESGYVYGESLGGGWISKPVRHEHFKNDEWNRYRVLAVGNRIQTWINDTPIDDVTDDRNAGEGFIGLQVHGVGNRENPMWAMWRNIRIRTIAPAAN